MVETGPLWLPRQRPTLPEFQPLLTPLNLEGRVITADALHAQVGHARFLVEEKKADYVFTVKENQPTLPRDIQELDASSFSPWSDGEGEGSRAH